MLKITRGQTITTTIITIITAEIIISKGIETAICMVINKGDTIVAKDMANLDTTIMDVTVMDVTTMDIRIMDVTTMEIKITDGTIMNLTKMDVTIIATSQTINLEDVTIPIITVISKTATRMEATTHRTKKNDCFERSYMLLIRLNNLL